MGLGRQLLGAAKPLWFVVVAGATITVSSGQAEPFVSASDLPQGPAYMFGGAAVALVAGWLVIGSLEEMPDRRGWRKAGARAGLTPEGSGLVGRPDLVGSVDGRRVSARTITRKGASHADGGTKTRTFTLVETELEEPVEGGVIVAPAEGGTIRSGATSLSIGSLEVDGDAHGGTVVDGNGFTALSDREELADAAISNHAGPELRTLEGVNAVYGADARGCLTEVLPEPDGDAPGVSGWIQDAMLGKAEGTIRRRIPGDAETVTAESPGVLEDGDRLRLQAKAVVALAEALEQTPAPAPEATEEPASEASGPREP